MRVAASGVRRTFLIAFTLFTCSSFAAAPAFDGFVPAGGARGTSNLVAATGKSEVWPPKVWVDGPGLAFTAGTNKGTFSVSIAPDAKPGPRLVRLYNEEGASDPHIFVIGNGRELAEVEPNNHPAKAQPVGGLPVTINGRLDKNGDVDSFAIDVRSGQWLDARVDSHTLMSKVDAVLRLVSTNGQQLAWNHDFITLDPRLMWRAPEEGRVILQIFGFAYPPDSGITLTGGESAVYRLHVAVTGSKPEICGSPTETEPNNIAGTAEPIDLPAIVHGTIGTGEDHDRFLFTLKKDEFIEARVDAASFGSPLDAWLKVEDSAGKALAQSDDVDGSLDPRLEWKAPTNGNFMIAVGSVTHRGGQDFCYRLSIQRAKPDFSATLGAGALELTSGATNELKLDLKRLRGFTHELVVAFRDLPPGVMALTNGLPPKDGAVSIPLAASVDAPRFQGSVGLFLMDAATQSERAVPFELTTRGETGYHHLLIETADRFWLTVRPKSVAEPKPAAKK